MLKLGDEYLRRMTPTDVEGVYSGYIRTPRVFSTGPMGTDYWASLELGQATFRDGRLELSQGATGHTSFTFAGAVQPNTPGTPSTPTSPSTPSTGGTVLLSQVLDGNRDSQTFYTVTVPSGTKRLEVKMVNNDQYARSMGDLFVRLGSRPSVSRTPTYSWAADCSSVNPNFEDELCVFPRSGSGVTPGTYHIMVFGYHAYYGAKLTATIWQ